MPDNDILDDAYVAALLEQDAKNLTGMFNLHNNSQTKPASKPKPNTRFLRNIIKDTDSHNAAMLAREAVDSRAKLRGLDSVEEPVRKAVRGTHDVRKRQLGDIAAILGAGNGLKRKRVEKEEIDGQNGSRRPDSILRHESLGAKQARPRGITGEKERSTRERPRADDEDNSARKARSRDRKIYSERRDREVNADERSDSRRRHISKLAEASEKEDRRKSRHRDRERSPRRYRIHRSSSRDRTRDDRKSKRRRSRSTSPREKRVKYARRRSSSPRRNRSKSPADRHERRRRSRSNEPRSSAKPDIKKTPTEEDYDSDPLASIIGPLPPNQPEIRTRGRGTFSHSAGIDSRFSADYDPTADVRLDPDEENDWDQALEALRDRTKWKQQGADRLKAAGFTDEEIKKWEKGGEKNEEDVRWSKKGEGREWDKGKILDVDGDIAFEPAFGRLKDN
ncbi:hypothetical protein GLAREA_08328 [Glarea lozoyensis ATCC 20868]|uniref:Uncharacterized protein n=1 Tax=Glarea lozoyensis (strain ATCC 20868 / MF5171) TaxID=1116229 RepID=S3CXC4_GLAL2|nr:uncharacterized protein GLAREA_08328 [Glarea lozoyensis ATCC 20868]EPE24476.1 hypothetical protein GLAREA_08328 [Glarea lozoyensis ATCC 20868]